MSMWLVSLAMESLLILEGGSVSLLQAIAADPRWQTYDQTWQWLPLQATDSYLSKAQLRVREMLTSSEGTRSMLDEIAYLWPDTRSHAVMRGIVGYRTAIAYAERCSIPITDLPRALSPDQVDHLTAEIAREYLVYARLQERDLPRKLRSPVTTPVIMQEYQQEPA